MDKKTFYICVGIVSFAIVVLQPMAMLAVMIIGTVLQA